MSRPNCPQCLYAANACLCAKLRRMSTEVEVIVLQDPTEVNHAKNSVKLMRSVLPNLQVVVGETAADFSALREQLASTNKAIFLLYPSEQSQSLSAQTTSDKVILLLLDGTWRKAYKLLQLNPWLLDYPAVHLDLTEASHYTIRKAKREDSLSTLEATAMAIKAVEPSTDVAPLTDALAALVEQRLQAMPASVRARYKGSK
ncbi:tRNA-uridine aminocarboxypropyltransferase [Shewanella colwelliana]|uniref:tRNA-uridine aminocarboxypropyltransferase n=1 Tax=Shewanella colwelliana TaxID=23 RepID=UPI00299D2BA9|nr:tRNA-uridine aminocarboxypropyltransferase [Shewanella colwelliana]MDX1280691.1 tRNA-uridine aminocarboxypropyltransferase [Shewanella colwelliana]